jgi:hypothetical protein
VKTIPLTRGQFTIIDDCDYERLSHFKWWALCCNGDFYAAYQSSERPRKKILMHRLVIYAPRGVEVDHINGDTLDNRRINLRLATHAQNGRNRRIDRTSTSGFKGVHFYRSSRRWNAQITFQGKRYNLGYFDTPELAAAEYDKAARLLFRQFARTNAAQVEQQQPH